MGWSVRGPGILRGACAAIIATAGLAGCGHDSPGTVPAATGCGIAPQPGPGSPLPYNLVDVSAVRGTRQAWVLAGRYGDPFQAGNFLLHMRGLTWTRAATFGRDVHLSGVAALSAGTAWVWGDEGHDDHWNTYRPYLALVSGGVVRRVRSGPLAGVSVGSISSDGPADAWLAGLTTAGKSRPPAVAVARWNGTSWSAVPAPAEGGAIRVLSPSGPADAWAVLGRGDVDPLLVRWNGSTWARAYTPPSRLATHGRVPQDMSAAASAGRAWVAYTEGGTNSGSNARNPVPLTISAYFDGGAWRMTPVPASADDGLARIIMSGGDAWAISAYQNIGGILYSRQGSAWCVQHLPRGRHLACLPTSISAASPAYVVAVSAWSSVPCRHSYAYVYDGHRWRTASPHPAG